MHRSLAIRPAPRLDAPYDDERRPHSQAPIDGSLALAFPQSPRQSVPLRLVPPAAGAAAPDRPGPRATLPDARQWAARLTQAVAEVLSGGRPPQHLAPVATLEVLAQLERGAGRLATRSGGVRTRPRVVSVHVGVPAHGVAETCAVVDTGTRRRALALRLESVDGRWICTVVQVG